MDEQGEFRNIYVPTKQPIIHLRNQGNVYKKNEMNEDKRKTGYDIEWYKVDINMRILS